MINVHGKNGIDNGTMISDKISKRTKGIQEKRCTNGFQKFFAICDSRYSGEPTKI